MTNDTSSQSDSSVKNYIASLDDEQTVHDCHVLIEMMQRISGQERACWPYREDGGAKREPALSGQNLMEGGQKCFHLGLFADGQAHVIWQCRK